MKKIWLAVIIICIVTACDVKPSLDDVKSSSDVLNSNSAAMKSTSDARKANSDSPTIIFNQDVAEAIKNYKVNYSRTRSEIEFENGRKVSDCKGYIDASPSRLKEGINNQIIMSEYLHCDVLSLIGNAPFSLVKDSVLYGKFLASRLDLRSFPSSLSQRLDDKRHTFNAVAGTAIKTELTSVSFESDDWHYRLELVASADVDRNGKNDWIVWWIDESRTGNYRAYQTLIIYDIDMIVETLTAVAYPKYTHSISSKKYDLFYTTYLKCAYRN